MRADMDDTFREFVVRHEPGLRRALAGHMPVGDVPDALAEAFAYAWQHWARVRELDNAGGYLFRVAQSRSRVRLAGVLPAPDPGRVPEFEPALAAAMRALTPKQRSAVWLIHGCGWTYADTAAAMGISASAVGTHLSRGMTSLRTRMGVPKHA